MGQTSRPEEARNSGLCTYGPDHPACRGQKFWPLYIWARPPGQKRPEILAYLHMGQTSRPEEARNSGLYTYGPGVPVWRGQKFWTLYLWARPPGLKRPEILAYIHIGQTSRPEEARNSCLLMLMGQTDRPVEERNFDLYTYGPDLPACGGQKFWPIYIWARPPGLKRPEILAYTHMGQTSRPVEARNSGLYTYGPDLPA